MEHVSDLLWNMKKIKSKCSSLHCNFYMFLKLFSGIFKLFKAEKCFFCILVHLKNYEVMQALIFIHKNIS